MLMYASSWVKRKSFYRKNEHQMFWLTSGSHIGAPKQYTWMWCLLTKLQKVAWNISANNSETVEHKDLRLGQIVYKIVFYNISFSWWFPIYYYDSENDLYAPQELKVFRCLQWQELTVKSKTIPVDWSKPFNGKKKKTILGRSKLPL